MYPCVQASDLWHPQKLTRVPRAQLNLRKLLWGDLIVRWLGELQGSSSSKDLCPNGDFGGKPATI